MNARTACFRSLLLTSLVLATPCLLLAQQPQVVPQIDGEWWSVADNPDLGECTTPRQEPVDFGVWQAADGTWQLWSCIRNTSCGDHTGFDCEHVVGLSKRLAKLRSDIGG